MGANGAFYFWDDLPIGDVIILMSKKIFLIEKFFVCLFVFCLPWQTRLILFKQGVVFNEWQSGFFYLTDLLFGAFLLLWLVRIFTGKNKPVFENFRLEIILGAFWLLGGASVFFAFDRVLGAYSFVRLTELLLIFFYFRQNFKNFSAENLFVVFLLAGVFQAVLAIGQFFKQASFGLKWLGEAPLSRDIAGVAKIDFLGQKIIRAYGTFPHPNLLAIFLAVVLLVFVAYILKRGFQSWQIAPLGIVYLGLLTSFARLAIILTLVALILIFGYELWRKINRKRVLGLMFLFVVFSALAFSFVGNVVRQRFNVSQTINSQAVDLRVYYNKIGWEVFKQNPWGVGVGNFVPVFKNNLNRLGVKLDDWMFQPIHNLYLLIAVELGFVGVVVFLWFLWEMLRRILSDFRGELRVLFLLIFCAFLIQGFFDHYFWTLQQGRLIFWAVLGIMAGYSDEKRPLAR